MTVRFQCSCGHKLKTNKKELIGTMQPCTRCGNPVLVPDAKSINHRNITVALIILCVIMKVASLMLKKTVEENRTTGPYTLPPSEYDEHFRREKERLFPDRPRQPAETEAPEKSAAAAVKESVPPDASAANLSGSAGGSSPNPVTPAETARLEELARYRAVQQQTVDAKIAAAKERLGRGLIPTNDCLAPDNLARDPSLAQTRGIVKRARDALSAFRDEGAALYEWPPPGVESLPEQSQNELKREWEKYLAECRSLTFPEWIALLDSVEEMLDFLAAKRGHWEVKASQMVFDSPAHTKEFEVQAGKVLEKHQALQDKKKADRR